MSENDFWIEVEKRFPGFDLSWLLFASVPIFPEKNTINNH